jgi:hypothetical protein
VVVLGVEDSEVVVLGVEDSEVVAGVEDAENLDRVRDPL